MDLTNHPLLASPQRPQPRKVLCTIFAFYIQNSLTYLSLPSHGAQSERVLQVSVQVPVADATAESGYATGAGASTVNVGAGAGAAGGGTPSTLWTTKEVLHRGGKQL